MSIATQYSLQNIENYKPTFTNSYQEIQIKYNSLVSEYLFFILENIVLIHHTESRDKDKEKDKCIPCKIENAESNIAFSYKKRDKVSDSNGKTCKSDSFCKFIIQRGLITITNVFNIILFYSKNLDMAYYHSQKAYYFYVEFIGQISEEHNTFLQLSSRDAILFIYKKTIFDIHNECKKRDHNEECKEKDKEKEKDRDRDREKEKEEKKKLDTLEKMQTIQQILLTSVIEGFDLHRANQQFYMKNHVQIIEKTMQKIANARFNIQQLYLLITFIERNQHLSENIFHVLLGYFIKKYAVHILFSQDDSIIKQRVLQWDPSQDFEKAIDEMFVGL